MEILEIFLYIFCIAMFASDIYFSIPNECEITSRVLHFIFLTPILFLVNYIFSLGFPFYDILFISYVYGYFTPGI